MKPLDAVLPAAAARASASSRGCRWPPACCRPVRPGTTFAAEAHRAYNRDGSAFDVGETFSGVDYETGFCAAQEFSALVSALGAGRDAGQAAIAWIVQQPGVSTVIPGARNVDQARSNAAAGRVGELPPAASSTAWPDLYDRRSPQTQVHARW